MVARSLPALERRSINRSTLRKIVRHHRRIDPKNWVHGLNYERCGELSIVIDILEPRFHHANNYLDIGTGISPLPSYVVGNSIWTTTCVDKFDWVEQQKRFAGRHATGTYPRFQVITQDFLATELPAESFDVITNVSVIEHFEGDTDSRAMAASAKLLKPGGLYVLTTPVNDRHFREFYLKNDVYGEEYNGKEVYYQRHYDLEQIQRRLIEPSGLSEVGRIYFGDYGFQCFEKVVQFPLPGPLKVARAFYKWATPLLAQRFLGYSDQPISRPDMHMNTCSGVVVLLTK